MIKTAFCTIVSVLSIGMYSSGSQAQTEPEGIEGTQATPAQVPACSTPPYRQLDFWIGRWDLSWSLPNGQTGHGTNVITKDPFGDCVIKESFDGAPTQTLKGVSFSMYSAPHGLWRQTWVDNQGGYFALYGGPQDDGTFILEMERIHDTGPHSRMVWEDVTETSLVWRWQGKAKADDAWADQWVINYVRKADN